MRPVQRTRYLGSVTAVARVEVADLDQRVFLQDVPWWQYEAYLAFNVDRAAPRITYLDGVLEFMSPSRSHERIKTTLARLFETYALAKRISLTGYGSMTLRDAAKNAGIEPDECYSVGPDKERPDLALEVIWSSGGLDKLEAYARLRVREVWVWRKGALELYALRGSKYAQVERSEVLPDLDINLLMSFVDLPDQGRAVLAYADALARQ